VGDYPATRHQCSGHWWFILHSLVCTLPSTCLASLTCSPCVSRLVQATNVGGGPGIGWSCAEGQHDQENARRNTFWRRDDQDQDVIWRKWMMLFSLYYHLHCERLSKLMNYSKNKSSASQIIKQILSFYWHSWIPIAGDLRVVHQLASWMRWMSHPLRHFLVWYSWVSAFSSMCYKVSTWINDKMEN
jgi:hypothetical protein